MSEKYYSTSPYMYVMGNPVSMYDVLGLNAAMCYNTSDPNEIADILRYFSGGGNVNSFLNYASSYSGAKGQTIYSSGRSGGSEGNSSVESRYVFHWSKGAGIFNNLFAFLQGYNGNNLHYYRVAIDPPTVIGTYAHEAFFDYVYENLDMRRWSVKNKHPDGIIDDLRYYGPNKKGSIWDIKSMTGDINIYAFIKDLKDIYPYLYSANFYKIDGYTWSLGSSNGNPKPFEGILPLKWGEYTFFYYIPNSNNGIIYYDYFVNVPKKQIETVPHKEPINNPVFLPIAAPRAILGPAFGILIPLFGFPILMQHQSVNDFQQPGT